MPFYFYVTNYCKPYHFITAVSLDRSFDGSVSDICHWADGVPFNLGLYQTLLESCFDINKATSVIEEVDELLELIKKTWGVLGINQAYHNLCLSWVFFDRYVATDEVEIDLLYSAEKLFLEVGKDAKGTKDRSIYVQPALRHIYTYVMFNIIQHIYVLR